MMFSPNDFNGMITSFVLMIVAMTIAGIAAIGGVVALIYWLFHHIRFV